MKKIVIVVFVAVFATIAGYSIHISQSYSSLSNLVLANVDALADDESWFDQWWESKTYVCQAAEVWEYKCMLYKDVPREEGSWEANFGNFNPDDEVCGYFKVMGVDCVGGNEVAHCWECE